jgi:pectate lyase
MFLPSLARPLAYLLSIGFLVGAVRAAGAAADPARDVLAPEDGWAGVATPNMPLGTTGGSNAAAARTVTVTNRNELVSALAWPDATPKLIYVRGSIDANVDNSLKPLTCNDYRRGDPATGERFDIYAFMAMYDPEGPLGKEKKDPFGGQENARAASAAAQAERIRIRIPPNTTLYGVGTNATLVGAWLDISGPDSGSQAMNVIIRNLTFVDTADCFPEWSPSDGPIGNWNSSYDSISIRRATHVWIDHNRFADLRTRDETQPTFFNRRFQVHDGLIDITDESDYITVSWNQFANHDKVMLIGNSDTALADRGRLRVTLHHNLFENVGQRTPRVRFGQVHVYNNVYKVTGDTNYQSSWGAGLESQIYAENNYFEMSASFGPMEVIDGKKGTRMTAVGNCWTEKAGCEVLDLIAEWNRNFDPDLGLDAGWKPTLYGSAKGADIPAEAREKVLARSGPGKL